MESGSGLLLRGISRMAGNTRGKLKEQFEGIHNNFNWVQTHIERALGLIGEHKPELSEAINSLGVAVNELDKLTLDIYSKL